MGITVEVKPAAGEATVGAFSVPVLVGPMGNAAPVLLTGTGTGLSVSPSPVDFGDIPDGQESVPKTITVTNVTDQSLPLSLVVSGPPCLRLGSATSRGLCGSVPRGRACC